MPLNDAMIHGAEAQQVEALEEHTELLALPTLKRCTCAAVAGMVGAVCLRWRLPKAGPLADLI